MIYSDFKGKKLSWLGMGAMRLPVIGGDDSKVDEKAVCQMVDYAMENGVNYFDTAYGYHGGNSEAAMGRALKKYPRESFMLADKFPGYDLNNMDKVEEIFEGQLKKCGVEYFDFYLFHNVYEKNLAPYLDEEKYGILPYLLRQKEAGRIRHLGFSCHGAYNVMKKFIDAYGKHMEFCQIQLNYLDWNFQDAKAKVELLNNLNIPIWVMEPLRGGRLAKLSESDTAALAALRSDASVPEWAFRFLQSVKGVKVVLSGMSSFEQMKENVAVCSENKPLSEAEFDALVKMADKTVEAGVLSCTACRYCTSHCPKQLNIPYLLSLYNEHIFTGGGFIAPMAIDALPEDKKPSACIACQSCEAVCPQQLKISAALDDFAKKLNMK